MKVFFAQITKVDHLPAGLAERLLQRVEFGRRHADVDRALGDGEDVGAGAREKRAELSRRGVVQDRPVLAAPLVLAEFA